MSTATLARPRRTLSGKLLPAGSPRPLTWHELVRPTTVDEDAAATDDAIFGPQDADLIDETPQADPLTTVPYRFRDLSDGDAFRFAGSPTVDGTTDPVGDTYRRRNRQGWYESTGGIKLRTGLDVVVFPV